MPTYQDLLRRYGHLLPTLALSSATYGIAMGEKRPTIGNRHSLQASSGPKQPEMATSHE